MSDAMFFSQLLLWIGFLALAAVVLALLRQVGILFERVAPAGALAIGSTLQAGDSVAPARVTALSGASLDVGLHRADGFATLMLFVAPGCPMCKRLLPVAKALARRRRVQVTYVSAGGDVQEHERFVADQRLPRDRYVVSDDLGTSFGAAKLPYAALVAADGRVSALGLVNTREHLESLFEAQRAGVASLQALARRDGSLRVPQGSRKRPQEAARMDADAGANGAGAAPETVS